MSPRAYCSTVRAEAAEATRQRLVEAAAALLHESGAEGCSLEAVAKAAGVTRLTVYKRFGSRHALLEAVFDEIARKGGLHRISEAMSDPDPVAGLKRLIAIFCDFWSFDKVAMVGLQLMGGGDQELRDSLHARNERRRKAFSVLVKRMTAGRKIKARAVDDLVDVLFVLTSFPVFSELARGRSGEAVQKLIQDAAEDAVRRGGIKI